MAFLPRFLQGAPAQGKAAPRTEAIEEAANWQRPESLFTPAPKEYDLVAQLTYMSALATANVGREQLFEKTAELGYSTSGYFHRVHLVAQRLNYDYARACQLVADATDDELVRSLLLRFSSSLASGEPETVFLQRETEIQIEQYSRKYERDLEALRKWTDAYVALMVSVTLVVVVSLVSMMIYSVGTVFILGLATVMIGVAVLGDWIIYRTAPVEPKTHRRPERSKTQEQLLLVAKVLLPAGALIGAAVALLFSVGAGMIAAAVTIAPVGIVAFIDDRKVDRYDADMATFIRSLGSIVAAIGTTVTEGMERMNQRSLGSLEQAVRRLHVRLRSGIKPELCWDRFVGETGSELVDRTVTTFWDTLKLGGDPDPIGYVSSLFAMKISLMRQARKLISQTFMYLMVPLHAVLIGIVLFVTEVMVVFATQLNQIQTEAISTTAPTTTGGIDVTTALAFASPDVGFIRAFALVVTIVLTAVDTWAPHAASGGHHHKLWVYAAVMLLISGVGLMLVPAMVGGLFESVSAEPTGAGAAIP
jgi:archaeal flagellar protein FlaJ